ncbi:Uncharacterised protein [Salmonella enterica subsp. enterica serovar Bovismorbificans]|uniref:Uncharacterized protein n=1 Tax=Salmonella enterica subsp. enterica serovar Bovismorbificans TaxID=58097 RepID=A0A655EL12_SALET|nr:Uncharacterised protein [Salmonella enterica subsp. enterica serovar Bovismorbificans]
MFNKHAHFALFFHAVGEEAGSATGAGTAFNVITNHANGDMHFALHFRLRGGDGVQTRRQRTQQAD